MNYLKKSILVVMLLTSATIGVVAAESPLKGVLFINEVDPDGDPEDSIELYNASDSDISLENFFMYDAKGVDDKDATTLSDIIVPANSFVVLFNGTDFNFGLSKTDEEVHLLDTNGDLVDEVTFPSESIEDGATYGRVIDGGSEWKIYTAAEASIGFSNMVNSELKGVLFINEVDPDGDPEDAIELYNAGDSDISLEGFFMYDANGADDVDATTLGEITVPANSFVVLVKDTDFNFGLGKTDEEVHLLDANGAIVDEVTLPSQTIEDGATYGRIIDGEGTWVIYSAEQATIGSSNNAKSEYNGVLFINEVDPDGEVEDWIELYNASASDINLENFFIYDAKGADDADATTLGDIVVPANGLVVLVKGTDFNFGLGKTDEEVHLLDTNGDIVDEVTLPSESVDGGATYGRITDGASEWKIFSEGTYGVSNSVSGVANPIMGSTIITSVSGKVVIDAVENDFATIYSIGGYVVATMDIEVGKNYISMDKGIYIVKTNNGVSKVIVY